MNILLEYLLTLVCCTIATVIKVRFTLTRTKNEIRIRQQTPQNVDTELLSSVEIIIFFLHVAKYVSHFVISLKFHGASKPLIKLLCTISFISTEWICVKHLRGRSALTTGNRHPPRRVTNNISTRRLKLQLQPLLQRPNSSCRTCRKY